MPNISDWDITIKVIVGYHFTPARIAIIKKIDNNNFGKDVLKLEPSFIDGGL